MKLFLLTLFTIFTITLLSSPPSNASEFQTVVLNIYEDTYSDSNDIWNTPWTEKFLKVGGEDTYRSYMKYSTQALENLGVLPNDIISAEIHLYHEYTDTGYQVYAKLFETSEDWDHMHLNDYNKPDLDTNIIYQTALPRGESWVSMDIIETMRKHLLNSETNLGYSLIQTNSGDQISHFWSMNCRNASRLPMCTGDQLPYVSVTYWPNNPPSSSELLSPINNTKSSEYAYILNWSAATDPDDEDIVYRLEISTDEMFTNILLSTNWLEQTEYEYNFHTEGTYYWRVISKDEHIEQYGSSMSEAWKLSIIQEEVIEEPVKEETIEEVVEVPIKEVVEVIEEEVLTQPITTKKEIIKTNTVNPQAYTPSIKEEPILGEVLGTNITKSPISKDITKPITSGKCKYRYNTTTDKVIRQSCNIPTMQTESISHIKNSFGIYQIDIQGAINDEISVIVDLVRCKKKTLWDPRTWRGCIEVGSKSIIQTVTPRSILQIVDKDKKLLDLNYHKINDNNKFDLSYITNNNYSKGGVYIQQIIYLSVKLPSESIWIDDNITSVSNSIQLPAATEDINNKPLRFPFTKDIGVTQWHGYTDYQSPHMGIDFGSTKEKIYALADGYIRSAMWDNYYGKCLSGGNVIRVEYDNGLHSVFMHLENYKNKLGKNWRIGERVKKGALLGITGNSGSYNCQPLNYHLHMEIRETRTQSSHVNPVQYINANWSMIPTLQYISYPGRLSGDNPHPGK